MTLFEPSAPGKLRVDIWSDVACPWCYIGKRRFEAALDAFPHRDDVEVVWHAFELDPGSPARREDSPVQSLAKKYGRTPAQAQAMVDNVVDAAAGEGLSYDYAHLKLVNTFRAHQVIALAAAHGLGPQMKEAFLRAYFTDGADLSETDTLIALAAGVGLAEGDVRAALESGEYGPAVRADEAQAQGLGISGVPFFVLGGKYGVSGAQNPEVFAGALAQVWQETHPAPLTMLGAADAAEDCADGSCAVPLK